ncbi:MAG TPA: S9 family peptidase [Bryobacteraceae bacterium]|jgi:oligopeptidase B
MSLTLTIPETTLRPPEAKIVPQQMTVHGDTRTDNYFWLRDRNDPDTIAYLEDENSYTRAMMRHTEKLQSKLYAEMLSHIQQTDLTVPVKRDGYFYYTRTEEGRQYRIYCRKSATRLGDIKDAPEEILLDGNVLAEGHKYFQIGAFAPSPDHKLLAYSVDYAGDEVFSVSIKNLETGAVSEGEIPKASHSLEWADDNATLFYTVLDSAKRPYKVFRHRLGAADDLEIFHEADQRFELEVSKTSSRAYILLSGTSSLTTEVRYLPADQPEGEFRVALPRAQGVEYDLTHHGDSFFIRTNDGAKTFRVVEAPIADCSKANWKEVLAARPEATIEGVSALAGYLLFEERERGLGKVRIRSFDTGDTHSIDFPEPVYSIALTGNAEYDTKLLRFTYTSLVTPASVFDYNLETRERELKKQQEVPGGYDPALYESERIYVPAPDGVEVPISLVYRKGMIRDGRSPMLLYGYGAYGLSMDPTFSSDRLSLLDRGIIYAIAHVRGGGDLGKLWHEDGRLLKKRNTFTDFIACAEALVAARYTSPDRLAMEGRSAGGLLVGAVVNMRPDLFSVVLAGVPFVDVLNTILDASLPLTVGEYEEWGNPNESLFYDYMKSYAPYENVRSTVYPSMLVTAGLNDPRVSYWEPAKWVAKLRAMKTDDRLLLLKTNMGSGHFGASGRYEYLKETAFRYAFLLNALGMEP